MLPLEEIADNPKAATISENLVLVADPFEDAKRRGILSSEKIDEVISALKDHFAYGASLIERFRGDLVSTESSMSQFDRMVVANAFEMLKIILENRPDILDKRMAKLYRDNRATLLAGKTPKDFGQDLSRLLKYTHEWRHFIEKRRGVDHFVALEKVPLDMGTLYMRDNPNKGFPNYALYGWFERIKTRKRIISKALYKIFSEVEVARGKKEMFYAMSFGTDYFGVRAIGSGQEIIGKGHKIRQKVEKIFHPTGTSPWICIRFEDYSQTKGKELRGFEYLLRYDSGDDQMPDLLQLQVFTLTDFLLGDFFLRDARVKIETRRNADLAEYERQNPQLYRKMQEAMTNALSFLPK